MQRKAAVRIGLPKPSSKPSLKRSIEFASKNAQTTFQIQAIATNREMIQRFNKNPGAL
jgi:hypothetical protein